MIWAKGSVHPSGRFSIRLSKKQRRPLNPLVSLMPTQAEPSVVCKPARTDGRNYAEIRSLARVRERALFLPLRMPSEIELQARWFAGDFGREFVTSSGERIDIVQFGIWNRESGPDFRDAAISINGAEPIRGSIEFDLADRNRRVP